MVFDVIVLIYWGFHGYFSLATFLPAFSLDGANCIPYKEEKMHCDVAEQPSQEEYVHLIVDRLGVCLREASNDIDEKDDGHLIHNVQLE